MNTYEYKAKNSQGKIYKGKINCKSEPEFYRYLEEKQLYCIEMEQKHEKEKKTEIAKWKISEIALFCREFSVMLMAGMNMLNALRLLYERAHKMHQKTSYMLMMEGIEKGDTLYDAMRKQRKVFPNLLLAMVLAGEASGTIDSVMDKMAAYYEKEADLRNKMLNAMIYPIVLICITVGVVILLFTFVLPKFFSLFEGRQVPAITRFFMGISNFLVNYWYILIILIVLFVLAIQGLQRSEKFHTKTDEWLLSIPIIGKLMEKLIVARFANAMNILYSSGITIVQAINISIGTVSNLFIAGKLERINEQIEKGVALSEAMQKEKLFDNMIWSMIQIGEESGSLETMFHKLYEYYAKESEAATQKMMTIMEPLVLIIIATIIAVVIASVLLPVYSMYQIG